MWAKPVGTAESFDEDLAVLLPKYPELKKVVDRFARALVDNPKLTRIPLDDGEGIGEFPGVFVHLLDYPPLGVDGLHRFRVTYHAPPRGKPNPWQQFTLLTIREHVRANWDDA